MTFLKVEETSEISIESIVGLDLRVVTWSFLALTILSQVSHLNK